MKDNPFPDPPKGKDLLLKERVPTVLVGRSFFAFEFGHCFSSDDLLDRWIEYA